MPEIVPADEEAVAAVAVERAYQGRSSTCPWEPKPPAASCRDCRCWRPRRDSHPSAPGRRPHPRGVLAGVRMLCARPTNGVPVALSLLPPLGRRVIDQGDALAVLEVLIAPAVPALLRG